MHTPTDPFYQRAFTLAAIAAIGLVVYRIVAPFLEPLAWAAVLALILFPAQRRLRARLGGRPGLAALLLSLFTVFLFTGPLTVLAIVFAAQAQHLVTLLADKLRSLGVTPGNDLSTAPFVHDMLGWFDRHLSISAAQIEQWALAGTTHLLQRVASFGGTAFFGAVGTVLSFTVMVFLLFFLLRDGDAISRAAIGLLPMRPERKVALVSRLDVVTRAVVMGTVVTALVQGLLLGLGFAISGLPAPVVFGVLGAILSVVPFGGTALVWVPGAGALFLGGHPGWGVFLLLWGVLLVSAADNFLKPVLIGGKAEVPTLAVFIGVLGGLSAFGLIGLFIGPVIMAMALALVRFALQTAPDAAP